MATSSAQTVVEPRTAEGARGLEAVLADPASVLLGLDFDGTLAPIVDDPASAHVHPGVVEALARLGRHLGKIAVVTGRPVRTALSLGGFADVDGLGAMSILGQYGVERWDAVTGEITDPPPPAGIAGAEGELPALLEELGLADAHVEHKGRAIGVHTRQMDAPREAFEALRGPVADLAARHDLVVEPGKNVLELRAHGTDKGDAVRGLVAETGARTVVFAGDDLGDLPAFEAVAALRAEGLAGLLVYSHSTEEQTLGHLADLEVAGPDEVATWLTALADALDQRA
ncbi:trehalose-phosphatase [Solicola sp. PLA-1-18]|uniref:trehalose-phosphatase n=1 Tax=Solicola sp. PLA-1-18 TaxID=3380532 RepID=UPI003B7EBBCD